jgi:hypothetical protein
MCWSHESEGEVIMLWTSVELLAVLWAIGLVTTAAVQFARVIQRRRIG